MVDSDARHNKARSDIAGMSYLLESRANADRLLRAHQQVLGGRFCPHDVALGDPTMRLMWTDLGWEDYLSWADDPKVRDRIHSLLASALEDPGYGLGEPVTHKYGLASAWSRHIDGPHRLVYAVEDDEEIGRATLIVMQARYYD